MKPTGSKTLHSTAISYLKVHIVLVVLRVPEVQVVVVLEGENAHRRVECFLLLVHGLVRQQRLHPVLEELRVQADLPEHPCNTIRLLGSNSLTPVSPNPDPHFFCRLDLDPDPWHGFSSQQYFLLRKYFDEHTGTVPVPSQINIT